MTHLITHQRPAKIIEEAIFPNSPYSSGEVKTSFLHYLLLYLNVKGTYLKVLCSIVLKHSERIFFIKCHANILRIGLNQYTIVRKNLDSGKLH